MDLPDEYRWFGSVSTTWALAYRLRTRLGAKKRRNKSVPCQVFFRKPLTLLAGCFVTLDLNISASCLLHSIIIDPLELSKQE
jgi:hypothetical protein